MDFKNFIKRVNQIYNILFIILLILSFCGICAFNYLYKNSILFLNTTYSSITIFSITFVCMFFVYFILYVFRLIYNKIYISKLFKNNIYDDIENDFSKIRFKKDRAIITDNYLIIGAFALQIIKLEDINSIFLTQNHKYQYIKNLQIICKNNRYYTVYEYYAEDIFKNIKKYVLAKNPNISFKPTKLDEKTIDRKVIIYDVFLLIIAIIVFFVCRKYLN